jgi:multiple sugar transport system permease protein
VLWPAIWPVDGDRLLISRPGSGAYVFDIIWALTQGGPGTMTETDLDLTPMFRDFQQFGAQLHGGGGVPRHLLLTVIVIWAIRRMGLAK